MGKISVLDCTLRDGGYINNWKFGEKAIRDIGQKIIRSHVEYFEVGFVKDVVYDPDYSIFSGNQDVAPVIAPKDPNVIYVGMVDMGAPIPLEKLGERVPEGFDGIRVIFKKDRIREGYDYCKQLIELGYITAAQLVGTDEYDDVELVDTVRLFATLKIAALSIVDTFGLIKRKDFLRMVSLIDHNMPREIALAYHSHNNLQQAMGNASALVEENLQREIIIDACVFGMGRGAGNLNLELFLEYLNEGYGKKYRIEPLLEVIDEYLNDIYCQEFWGYSLPFYLSATTGSHPNYAKYFAKKGTLTLKAFNEILRSMPYEVKKIYSAEKAEQTYIEFQKNYYDDKDDMQRLRNELHGKSVMLVGAGATVEKHAEQIRQQIREKDMTVISLNHISECITSDYVFSSHMRRYSKIQDTENVKKIITSNIRDAKNYDYQVNFSSFASDKPEIMDNSGIMCMKLLMELGVTDIYLAGFDGYDSGKKRNYINSGLEYGFTEEDMEKRNRLLKESIEALSRHLSICFVTDSMYC